MKVSIESILAASLSDLKELNQSVDTAEVQEGPVEGLLTIDSKQIEQEVLEHMQDERYTDETTLRQVAEDFFASGELDRSRAAGELKEVREVVTSAVTSLEMLGVLASMESITDETVEVANKALGAVALQTGTPVPVIEAEDGKVTEASMEGLLDFIKAAFAKMKKWIKEKLENIRISMRRGFTHKQALIARLQACQKRLESLPEEYGIPGKPLRYDTTETAYFYLDGKEIEFEAADLKKLFTETYKLLEYGVTKLADDASERSVTLGTKLPTILVARDQVGAEEIARGMYKDVTKELPVSKAVKYGRDIGGINFVDGSMGYRSRYRDAEWIMELVNLIEANQLFGRHRRTGRVSGKAVDLNELREILDIVADNLEKQYTFDFVYYYTLVEAWGAANNDYERLVGMVQGADFPQMNSELWRAVDIACNAMFYFLDKAYYHAEVCRDPHFRVLHASLYVAEEQLKAYVATNR
jgi:hypothetical protein